MWLLAALDQQGWINLAITGIVTGLGSGGLASVITTHLNNRKEEKKEQRLDINTLTLQRVTVLEERDIKCNERVTALEKKNWEWEREAMHLKDQLLRIENDLVVAVISADSMMKVLKWNAGASLMFGYMESEMLGQDVDVLVPGNLKQKHHDAYDHAVSDIDGVVDWKNARAAIAVHKDGHEFPIQLYITSFTNGVGNKFFEARITKPRAI